MKRFNLHAIAVFTVLVAFILHQAYTYSLEEEFAEDGDIDEASFKRQLTAEEEILANEARAEIAKAIENNLVRAFAVMAAQNGALRQGRQDEDEEEVITPNPNVLPQVAQILGAIFSGNLNITRVVDSTIGLVPNLVRNQIQGLVKLLTGENVNLTGETTTAVPPPPITIEEIAPQVPIVPQVPQAQPALNKPQDPVVIKAVTTQVPHVETNPTNKGKYRVRNKTRVVASTPAPADLGDDEVDKFEKDLRAAGRAYEAYAGNKEPRFYAGAFETLLKNVNMTQVAQAVPTIFKGAEKAISMLDNLGVIDRLPGIDVLDELVEEEE